MIMNKAKVHYILEISKYSLMILIIFGVAYILFFSDNNFCVETHGVVDAEDEGKRCFKTISDANDYKLYLIDKYDLDKTPDFGFNLSFNLSD